MTIINFVQNNHQPRSTSNASSTSMQAELRLRLLSGWVAHLSWINQQSVRELTQLQTGFAAAEGENRLAYLSCLQEGTKASLERLSRLLNEEIGDGPAALPVPPPGQEGWIWGSLQLFFEEWNPEMAEFQLWTMVRPVLSGQLEATEQEREDAASFYELTKLLLGAAWVLYKGHTAKGRGY